MKTLPISGKKKGIILLDDSDHEWASKYRWHLSTWGYPIRGVRLPDGKHTTRRLSCEILKLSDDQEVDHKNRNPLDNQRKNLRPASKNQNSWNKGLQKNNSTGVKGVSWRPPKGTRRGRFVARIMLFGKHLSIGSFQSLEEAEKAIIDADKKHRNEFSIYA